MDISGGECTLHWLRYGNDRWIGLTAMKFTGLMLRLTVACLIVFAGVAILQDRFIYLPEKAATEDVVSSELRAWPTPDAFRGLVAEPAGCARATVIVFHGNAGHAGHRSFYAAALTRLGLRVILSEYPGYGPRDGTPGEGSLVAAAAEVVKAECHAFISVRSGRSRGSPAFSFCARARWKTIRTVLS